jgi:hypothetical protein
MEKTLRVSLGAAVGILVALSSGCEGGPFASMACTLVGCESGSEISVPVGLPFAELTSKTLEFCRNQACVTTSLAALTLPRSGSSTVLMAGETETSAETRGDSLEVSLDDRPASGSGLSLDLSHTIHDQRTAHEGDRYRVRLLGPDGAAISLFDKTARYVDNEPNGPDCGPVCKVADFQP